MNNKLSWRIKKEHVGIPLMIEGLSRRVIGTWFDELQRDKRKCEYDPDFLAVWHKRGYLSSSLKRWDLNDTRAVDYISDLEYCCLSPMNSSFGKWLEDMLTTQRVISPAGEHFRNVYFSIIQRENSQLILRAGKEDREYTVQDILELLREKGTLELRPAYWNSNAARYALRWESATGSCLCNGEPKDMEALKGLIQDLRSSYVVADTVQYVFNFAGKELFHAIKFWITNDLGDKALIQSAEMYIYTPDPISGAMDSHPATVDLQTGRFTYRGEAFVISGWDSLKEAICRDASKIPQISYYSTSIALHPNGDFTYLRFSKNPTLPQMRFSDEFNAYLKNRYNRQFHKRSAGEQAEALWKRLQLIERKSFSRKGMRPYMYGLWRSSAWDDLLHTKGVSLPEKLWAHKHGFFSWHLYQYGITKENYQQFLSDYDYYWLNRINNGYQKWVNDKTTYRMVMEPFKQYVPQYYFSVFKRNGNTVISKMWDCPDDVPDGFDGVLEMLKRKGKLAFKASAGTHGDGFYCLSLEGNAILANGKPCGTGGLQKLIEETQSFYIITEYLEMHQDLKKIYAKSVNTVRMMVINEHGYDPKIMQTYMRIGSSRTGYTDNVGYGGICVFVDKDTGELYQPETIKDHVFYDCPVHPDTGTPIAGRLPHWELIQNTVMEICRYLCELEYLGFDIAITDEGFQILEINIHQDLHKVACFTDDIKEYFHRKLMFKYESQNPKPENQ